MKVTAEKLAWSASYYHVASSGSGRYRLEYPLFDGNKQEIRSRLTSAHKMTAHVTSFVSEMIYSNALSMPPRCLPPLEYMTSISFRMTIACKIKTFTANMPHRAESYSELVVA